MPTGSAWGPAAGRRAAAAPAALAREVVARGAALGFALGGDADRLVVVDRRGRVVDGDQLLGLCALDRLGRGALTGGILVVTVLSNGGLEMALGAKGGQVVRTPVGDKYILDGMQVTGANLGGEKSGHVIVLDYASTGDGLVTALEVLGIVGRTGRPVGEVAGMGARPGPPIAERAAGVPPFPQEQRAIHVRHKEQWEADPELRRAIAAAEARLSIGGRVLVRPSGTESALRVMVEGQDHDLVGRLADELAALAGDRLKQPRGHRGPGGARGDSAAR